MIGLTGKIELIPLDTIVRLGRGSAKAQIVGYEFDEYSFDGWHYKMKWVSSEGGTFSWPRVSDSPDTQIRHLTPLEQLGLQAE